MTSEWKLGVSIGVDGIGSEEIADMVRVCFPGCSHIQVREAYDLREGLVVMFVVSFLASKNYDTSHEDEFREWLRIYGVVVYELSVSISHEVRDVSSM